MSDSFNVGRLLQVFRGSLGGFGVAGGDHDVVGLVCDVTVGRLVDDVALGGLRAVYDVIRS